MPTRSRFLSAPPPTPCAAWWRARAKARSATTPSDGTSTTSSHCRRATGSFTRAAAAQRACSRCPTAICTPGSGFLRKNTGISRLEASSVPWRGGGFVVGGERVACAWNLSRRGMLPAGKRGYKAPLVLRCVGTDPAPMAQVANENTGSAAAAPSVTDSASYDKSNLWALALGSVGVVYGDIGTSPLYAFRVAVVAAVEFGPVRRDIVLGVPPLILGVLIV